MSVRLSTGGNCIDRSKPIHFQFNGKKYQGFEGDSIASALLANDKQLVGRSFKYHRPRGVISSGAEEPNALFMVDYGGEFAPNQVGTMVDLKEGMNVYSQNHWPTLENDFGSVLNILSRFIPAGFYYKTFIEPKRAWESIYEPAIRQSAGLGRASRQLPLSTYEQFYVHVDFLIIGGGIAGLLAAKNLARTKKQILLVEQNPYLGGQYTIDSKQADNSDNQQFTDAIVEELSHFSNVTINTKTTLSGAYDHDYYLAEQKRPLNGTYSDGPARRLWKIRADKVILATGAIERPLCFVGNDIPGVQLASGVRDYLSRFAVSPGDRTVVITNNDDGYRTALALNKVGLDVPVVLDTRQSVQSTLYEQVHNQGIEICLQRGISKVVGSKKVNGIEMCSQVGEGKSIRSIECDAIAMSGGWSPAVHIWSHCGGKLKWDEGKSMFIPDWNFPPINALGNPRIFPVGLANGISEPDNIQQHLAEVLSQYCRVKNFHSVVIDQELEGQITEPIKDAWLVPEGMTKEKKQKAWVDFQNDVKVSDLELAIQEGYQSIEHTKRYTTLGMATDQGKTSNVIGLALVAQKLAVPIPQVGTTTFRPPYSPVTFGSIAGQARGELFKPVRKTPIDAWHDSHGAIWEPVGDWRRPYCYPKTDESEADAVNREALRVRTTVGIVDASTLGKILVKGKDARKFLDMIYTNMMSNLKVGKCRYGLMCDENGFLMDDGVVACLDEDTFLCHTTTGGADSIFAWMEEWLQCEWWKLDVYLANLTEEYVQIGVAGKDSKQLLEKIGGINLEHSQFPFMSFQNGTLGKFKVRVFRISFSGELAYELSVEAQYGLELWELLLKAGEEFFIEPYGTEALHVLRAEKGFVMIGEETDGTVTPQDLGLTWAISKKKDDFIGKRGQQRTHLTDPNRWQFVGLEIPADQPPLPHGVYAVSNELSVHGYPEMEGRVTSSYYSPILKRPIALGLVKNGTERMGETISFKCSKKLVQATIVNPEFYDPERTLNNG